MQRMPEFIKAIYEGKGKDDYALKAKITMDGLKDHPGKGYILRMLLAFCRVPVSMKNA